MQDRLIFDTMALRISLLVFILLNSLSLLAQKKDKESMIQALADNHFARQEFYLAAQEYGQILDKDSSNAYLLNQLGECYRLYFDFSKAETFYRKLSDNFTDKYPYSRFWYATCLMENSRFDDAVIHFTKYREEPGNGEFEAEIFKEKALQEIDNCKKLSEESKEVKSHMHGFRCLPKPINSPEGEYAPVIFENDTFLLVTSTRKGTVGGSKDNSFGGVFSDIYRFKKTSDSAWTIIHHNHHDEFHKLNTHSNESSGSMTADKKKFYFTRCDELINKEYNCAIYVSRNVNGKWEKGVRLDETINMPGQWNSQPSISGDGNFLFFVSKRPGGFGMQDIWYSISDGTDGWSPPINLGPQINTPFTDMSPTYIGELKILFFSSNGHPGGHGGIDIYMAREADNFKKLVNLGQPFNSPRDDFYFTLGSKKGYLTSNRAGGIGFDDLYIFDIDSRKAIVDAILNRK